jgi:hypothetical protein
MDKNPAQLQFEQISMRNQFNDVLKTGKAHWQWLVNLVNGAN